MRESVFEEILYQAWIEVIENLIELTLSEKIKWWEVKRQDSKTTIIKSTCIENKEGNLEYSDSDIIFRLSYSKDPEYYQTYKNSDIELKIFKEYFQRKRFIRLLIINKHHKTTQDID